MVVGVTKENLSPLFTRQNSGKWAKILEASGCIPVIQQELKQAVHAITAALGRNKDLSPLRAASYRPNPLLIPSIEYGQGLIEQ